MGSFVLAIDQGTTGTTALLIDSQTLKIASEASKDYPQIYPKPGWVEHDLNEIWKTVGETVNEVLTKISASPKDIVSIGITNQRETTCAYTKDGMPLHHALVWQDRRTSEFCAEHREDFNKRFKPITGLPLDPYFSATKMKWLLENSSAVQNANKDNNLCLSTIDTFVLFKLTQGQAFATEPSNASRTQLLSLDTFSWNDELLSFFKIPRAALPKVQDTFSHFGETKGLSFLPDGIPVTCLFGDQQSALFGQACLNVGDLKCTYGTGAFLLVNTGEKAIHSKQGLLTTAAYGYKGKKVYALEGSSYIAGAAVQWLRDSLKMIVKSSDVESLASRATDLQMEHLLFYPYFSGIGAPYWVPEAKAAILGMTRDTGTAQIARACLEGITLAVNDCVKAFIKDLGHINDIKVDGGATANNLLMQSQSNFSKKNILRPQNIETTAYGAALGSMVGNGKIDIQEVSKHWKLDTKFQPSSKEYADKKSAQWENTIQKVFL